MSTAIPPSRWLKCISTNGAIRGVAIQATDLVRSMAAVHQLDGMQAQGLGEAVMAALLVASYCKPGEKVNLNIRGSGQFVQGLVDANPDGTVRGYVIPRKPSEAFFGDRGEYGPWGSGTLSILRKKGEPGSQPYIGTVPLITGHLAKDLTFYWAQSEQVPSAVGLSVKPSGNDVVAAGGFLIQAMPEATPDDIKLIEKHLLEINQLPDAIAHESDPLKLLASIFQSTPFVVLEDRPIRFDCPCSRERAERALLLSGVDQMKDLLEKEGHASIRCDFCAKEYIVDGASLRKMIESAGS